MSLTFTIILFFFGAGVITVAFIRDWYNKKKWGWYKTLLITGFIALSGGGVYDLAKGYLDEIADNAAMQESASAARKTNAKTDTVTQDKRPALFSSLGLWTVPNTPNPVISKTAKGDSVKVTYELANYGNTSAFHIHDETIYGHLKHKKVYIDSSIPPLDTDSTLVINPLGKTKLLQAAALKHKGFISRNSFVCIRVNYADSVKSGSKFIKIFYITSNPLSLHEVSDADYTIIETALKKEQ
ncbi:hypothetical protein FO440_03425 [Mucilaginibacter corticis]|uniref:Uncharacterized protein n=1 Tax=Mucilaginibacter corticis TaxID=2597670 RepID=A0A556MTP7_9SPHI|nr:hypothetical protein [Mucilaginibacter corticis]TSJ43257.1 hypothetical protein FO440_03425 [Mucilaginibacter corticis]